MKYQPILRQKNPWKWVLICENFGKTAKSAIFLREKNPQIWVGVSDFRLHTTSKNNLNNTSGDSQLQMTCQIFEKFSNTLEIQIFIVIFWSTLRMQTNHTNRPNIYLPDFLKFLSPLLNCGKHYRCLFMCSLS